MKFFNILGNEYFKELEHYEYRFGNSCTYYAKQLKVIDYFYREGGKAEQLIQQKRIKDLLDRKDALIKKKKLFETIINCFWGILISGSFFSINFKYEWGLWTNMNFWIVMIACVGFFIYRKSRGQAGSYLYLLHEYEISKIDEWLHKAAGQYKPEEQDGYFFRAQQIILDALTAWWGKAHFFSKKKKALEEYIHTIESIDVETGRDILTSGEWSAEIGRNIFAYIKKNQLMKEAFIETLMDEDYIIIHGIVVKCGLLHLFEMKVVEGENYMVNLQDREIRRKESFHRNLKSSISRICFYILYCVAMVPIVNFIMIEWMHKEINNTKELALILTVLGFASVLLVIINLLEDISNDKLVYSITDVMPELENVAIQDYEKELKKYDVEELVQKYRQAYEKKRKRLDISNKTMVGGMLTIFLPILLAEIIKSNSTITIGISFLLVYPILLELAVGTMISFQNESIRNTKSLEKQLQDKYICKILEEEWGVELDKI